MATRTVELHSIVGDVATTMFSNDMESKYQPGNRDSLTARNLITLFLDIVLPDRDRGNDNTARVAAANYLGLVRNQS